MNQSTIAFRSKSERERESQLVRNYREIGIAAIAAASHACRKDRLVSANSAERIAAVPATKRNGRD